MFPRLLDFLPISFYEKTREGARKQRKDDERIRAREQQGRQQGGTDRSRVRGDSLPGNQLRREPVAMGLYPQGLRHPGGTAGSHHRGLRLRGVVGSGQRAPPRKFWPLTLPLFNPLHL